MKQCLFGLFISLQMGFSCAAAMDDPVQVTVGNETDHIVLSAHFFVPVARNEAWNVLVDFEHMPSFLPHMRESRVLFRQGNLLRVQQRGVFPIAFFDVNYNSIRDIELFPMSEIKATSVGGDSGLIRSVSRLLQSEHLMEIDYRADWWPTSQMVAGFGFGSMRDLLAHQFTAMRLEMLRRKSL